MWLSRVADLQQNFKLRLAVVYLLCETQAIQQTVLIYFIELDLTIYSQLGNFLYIIHLGFGP